MRIGYAVMYAIVQQKSTFLFFVIFILDNGIYCQLYINNIENGNTVFCQLSFTLD